MQYWWNRVKEVSPTWTGLRDTCRAAGIEVMYTVIQSLTADGRDQSLDYKISGFHVPPGSFDAQVREAKQSNVFHQPCLAMSGLQAPPYRGLRSHLTACIAFQCAPLCAVLGLKCNVNASGGCDILKYLHPSGNFLISIVPINSATVRPGTRASTSCICAGAGLHCPWPR